MHKKILGCRKNARNKLIYVKLTVILLKIKKITVVSMANVYYI